MQTTGLMASCPGWRSKLWQISSHPPHQSKNPRHRLSKETIATPYMSTPPLLRQKTRPPLPLASNPTYLSLATMRSLRHPPRRSLAKRPTPPIRKLPRCQPLALRTTAPRRSPYPSATCQSPRKSRLDMRRGQHLEKSLPCNKWFGKA